jgi:hypothetical protein
MSARILLAGALTAGLAACELAEVAAPPGDDILVVEAVLRVGARQFAILHRSLDGRSIRGESDASIVVTTPQGDVAYQQVALEECLVAPPADWKIEDLEVEASCYASPIQAGSFVRPGATYELLVRTRDGLTARGRTTVPADFRYRVPGVAVTPDDRSASCLLPDTAFTLVWGRSQGAWGYVVSLRIAGWGEDLRQQGVEVPDPIELTGVSVSAADTSLVFPTNLGLFQRADQDQRVLLALQDGVPAGAEAELAVVAADPNYTNAIRGGRFNPSGNVRGSSVSGDAIGVFGAVVPIIIRSTHSPPAPACTI